MIALEYKTHKNVYTKSLSSMFLYLFAYKYLCLGETNYEFTSGNHLIMHIFSYEIIYVQIYSTLQSIYYKFKNAD